LRNESDAGHTRYRECDAGKLFTQQQLHNQRRNDQQRQSRDSLGDGGESQRILHHSATC
jgi:hypothetical protein